jgi:nicotinamidase/pyrazinamidase
MTSVVNVLFGVDPQRGFCPKDENIPGTGELPVPDGDSVMAPAIDLATALAAGDPESVGIWGFALSADCHPPKTDHFKKWPVHCVRETPGALFHPRIALLARIATVFYKGTSKKDDGYSAFEGKPSPRFVGYHRVQDSFTDVYRARACQHVFYVWGLATDYCVLATVLDLLKAGYKVVLLTDAIRAVDVKRGDGRRAIKRMVAAGAVLKTTKEVANGFRLSA